MNVKQRLDRLPLEYSLTARRFHWWSVGFVAVLITLGSVMTDRTADKTVMVAGKSTVVPGIWDATTNALYSSHKLIGFVFLLVVLARPDETPQFSAVPSCLAELRDSSQPDRHSAPVPTR